MVLKPCATKTTIEGDSSKFEVESMEAASSAVVIEGDSSKFEVESMEVSSGIVNSCPTKRKAEFEPEEEEVDGEIEESSEEEEEEAETVEKIDWLKPPEWDVDSFEGLEYYSTPDAIFSSPSDEDLPLSDPKDREVYCSYKRQLIDSHGFYTDPELKPNCFFKEIRPVSLDWEVLTGKTYGEYWEEMSRMCLQKLNQEKGLNVEFVQLVRGYHGGPPRSKSYITFMAREKPDGPLVEYQAKSLVTFDGKRHPILCRPAPTPKT